MKTPAPKERAALVSELPPIAGARVWRGPDMVGCASQWTYRFGDADLAELDLAVERTKALGVDVVNIRREDFPLPKLEETLSRVRDDLLHGVGFAVIRGFPVDRYGIRETAIAYFGLGSHMGEAVSQNARGHALGHVCDLGLGDSLWEVPAARGYQTAERLIFHTDASDLVGLLCLRTAKSGGLSRIASTGAIYNALLEARPDLLRALMEPIYRDRRDEIPEGRKPWYRLPIFNLHEGRLLTNYVRSVIQKAQRFPEAPRLTDELVEAMDLLDRTAADPTLYLELEFEPGDIQFLCNSTTSRIPRTAYRGLIPSLSGSGTCCACGWPCDEGPPLPPPSTTNSWARRASGRPNGYRHFDARRSTHCAPKPRHRIRRPRRPPGVVSLIRRLLDISALPGPEGLRYWSCRGYGAGLRPDPAPICEVGISRGA